MFLVNRNKKNKRVFLVNRNKKNKRVHISCNSVLYENVSTTSQ